MLTLFCAVVKAGEQAFHVVIDVGESVAAFKEAIMEKISATCNAKDLRLFLAKTDGAWLADGEPLYALLRRGVDTLSYLEMDDSWTLNKSVLFGPNVSLGEVHVLVEVLEDADLVWYGYDTCGSIGTGDGIDPTELRTLSRTPLVDDIIRRLEARRVLLVAGPPMTGKTSLAALVRFSLVNMHTEESREKKIVFNFSACEDENFEASFKRQCGIDWIDAVTRLPKQARSMVYLVLDEAHVIYRETPRRKSIYFWHVAKDVLDRWGYNVRVLGFAAYCPGVCAELEMSIDFNERNILNIDQLNFSHAEVYEYVTKWFKGIACFEQSWPAMKEFCANLQALTGALCHCVTVIQSLNGVVVSRGGSGTGLPSPAEWIRMLQSGSLDEVNEPTNNKLIEALVLTRAVKVLTRTSWSG